MIKAIITDLDGTLVDTFDANFMSYRKSFAEIGYELSLDSYRMCFGLRFDDFMAQMGIVSSLEKKKIQEMKKEYYPIFFHLLKPNKVLIDLLTSFHDRGLLTAIASTARKENLMNVLDFMKLAPVFDVIFAGKDVSKGKPDPEIYLKTMEFLKVSPDETLIFEDSEIGISAARASGAKFIHVTPEWFER